MIQDPKFNEALLHIDHTICGRRLFPFCAAYAAALAAVGSPLMSTDPQARVTPEDLLYALEVCSSEIDPATMCPLGVLDPQRRWGDLAVSIFSRFRQHRFERLVHQWLTYYRDYVSEPQLCEAVEPDGTTKAGAPLTGPYYLSRVCSVLKQYPGSITEYRAWSMPLGLLVWMDEQGKELEGVGRPFWNAGEDAAINADLAKAEEAGRELLRKRKQGR